MIYACLMIGVDALMKDVLNGHAFVNSQRNKNDHMYEPALPAACLDSLSKTIKTALVWVLWVQFPSLK